MHFAFGECVSSEENLSLKTRRTMMTMRKRSVVSVILSALKLDGAVVDSRLLPVVLGHLWDVAVG